jgi:hypothetical protein
MKPLTLVVALISAFVLSANAADTFKLDPVHSFVLFSVQHLGIANTYGRFNDISGTVVFDKDNPSKSSVELSVPVLVWCALAYGSALSFMQNYRPRVRCFSRSHLPLLCFPWGKRVTLNRECWPTGSRSLLSL